MSTVASAVEGGAIENIVSNGSSNNAVEDPQDAGKMCENQESNDVIPAPAVTSEGSEKVKEKDGILEEREMAPSSEVKEVHLGKIKFVLVSIALCLGLFIPSLDESIIATAIPKLTTDFNSLGDVGWYGSTYMMTSSAFQFFFGKCYIFFTPKWVFMISVVIFEVGSLVCATAGSSVVFIIGRALAGLGTSGVISGSINLITQIVPLQHRAAYYGTIGAITGLSSLAGPVLGGVFSDSYLTWRWCFWINLPIGGFTLFVLVMCVPNLAPETTDQIGWRKKIHSLDLGGTAILLPAIVCLLLALQYGGSEYAWSNVRVIVLLVLAVVLVVSFFGFERWMGESASIPVRVITKKNVAYGALYVFFIDGGFYIIDYYLPIWFQAIKGKTAEQSGIASLPFVAAFIITYMLVGYAVSAVGYYHPFMLASSTIASVGAGLLTTLQPISNSARYISFQIIFGMGIGMGNQLPVVAVQAVLSPADMPLGVAVICFFQVLGPAVFISIAQSVFDNRLVAGLEAKVPGFHNSAAIANTGILSVIGLVNSTTPTEVVVHAYNVALNQTWYIVVALASLSVIGALGMDWKSLKDSKAETSSAEN